MKDLGTVRPGSTIYIEFDSFGASGESLTLTGLAATDVEVYKDGGTTQRASDNGYTLLDTDGIDFDGITGIHGLSINLADNSTAGFWAAGSHYRVVISSVTINSQTVSFTAATFRIGYPDAIINTTIATLSSQTSFTLTNGPAEDDALNGFWAIIHDVASAVQLGYAIISDYTGSTKTVTLAAGTTFTAAAADNISIMGPMPIQAVTAGRKLDTQAGTGYANASLIEWSGTSVGSATSTGSVPVNITHFGNVPLTYSVIGSTGNSTTALHLDNLTFGDDELNTFMIAIHDVSAGETHLRWITDWDSFNELATVATLPFTPQNAVDLYCIIPVRNDPTIVGNVSAVLAEATHGGPTAALNLGNSTIYGTLSVDTVTVSTSTTPAFATDAISAGSLSSGAVSKITADILAQFSDDTGTAQAGAAGTITLRSGAVATDDYYNGAVVCIYGGTGAGQSRRITDYVGSTKVATTDSNWTTNPDNTSTYFVIGRIV